MTARRTREAETPRRSRRAPQIPALAARTHPTGSQVSLSAATRKLRKLARREARRHFIGEAPP
jgi:hypothetical protein